MNLEKLIQSAQVLLTDKDNVEYLRGICELLAVAFPGPDFESHCDTTLRAKEIENLIFPRELGKAKFCPICDGKNIISGISYQIEIQERVVDPQSGSMLVEHQCKDCDGALFWN